MTHSSTELARAIGLSPLHGFRWELRSELVTSIKQALTRANLTHSELAKKVKTSRSRITSIVNFNIDDVSTDLLLRILETLGYRVTISVTRAKLVA